MHHFSQFREIDELCRCKFNTMAIQFESFEIEHDVLLPMLHVNVDWLAGEVCSERTTVWFRHFTSCQPIRNFIPTSVIQILHSFITIFQHKSNISAQSEHRVSPSIWSIAPCLCQQRFGANEYDEAKESRWSIRCSVVHYLTPVDDCRRPFSRYREGSWWGFELRLNQAPIRW